jgi:tRNA nucleotidyltransferase (CCA-adding enzyme)
LAALFHDIGKPASRRWSEEKKDWTFYGHDIIGAKMTFRILTELKFSKKIVELVAKLVRYHLFFSDTEKITLSAVRRTVRNIGPENVWDLMKVRFSDRIGMGRPKETPYRLRKYEAMIDEAMKTPLSVGMLKIDGNRLMKTLNIEPGPKIGQILHILLDEVLDEPERNTEIWLETKAKELGKFSEGDLKKLGDKAKLKKDEAEWQEISEIRNKWGVK